MTASAALSANHSSDAKGRAKQDRPQLDALTGLRGIAAWFVVFYHIRFSLNEILPEAAIAVFAKGYLAVDLFFMLSGFVMWLSYGPRFERDGLRQTGPFLWKRFARVWPLHALVLAGFTAFVAVLVGTGRSTQGYPLDELPLHFLLIQNWGMTDALTWNHPAWSISTEFGAYLLFPLVVAAVPWARLGRLSLIAVLGALGAALHLYFSLQGFEKLGADIASTGLTRCLFEFTAGIALARLWQLGGGGLAAVIYAVIALVLAAAWIVGPPKILPETLLVPAILACLLMACAHGRGIMARVLSSRPLIWLGDTSYAVYLSHFLGFILFKIAFVGADFQLGWLGLIAFLISVQAVSAILYSGFEKPAQKWLNQRPLAFARAG